MVDAGRRKHEDAEMTVESRCRLERLTDAPSQEIIWGYGEAQCATSRCTTKVDEMITTQEPTHQNAICLLFRGTPVCCAFGNVAANNPSYWLRISIVSICRLYGAAIGSSRQISFCSLVQVQLAVPYLRTRRLWQ